MTDGPGNSVWQIAAGDHGRDYSSWLLLHDLACLGPGDLGEYEYSRYANFVQQKYLSAHKAGAIRQFKDSVRPGDRVLLRRGHRVVAVGVFADEPYSWNEAYDDVRGWDLQHSRRVLWQQNFKDELKALQEDGNLFGNRKQIPMFTRVQDARVLRPISAILNSAEIRELKPLPAPPSTPLTEDELANVLFSRGLSHQATASVVAALSRQRRLIDWYWEHHSVTGRPTEHEVVAHVVLPLLLALGWSEQLLAVEWNRIDLAGFSRAPTISESCSLVCEAKGLFHGLAGVLEQAVRYVDRNALANCNRILLTNGARFYLYRRTNDTWQPEPAAYLNVHKPRLRNSDGTDGVDLILALRQP